MTRGDGPGESLPERAERLVRREGRTHLAQLLRIDEPIIPSVASVRRVGVGKKSRLRSAIELSSREHRANARAELEAESREVDVLVRLPGTHHVVAADVVAAEAHERPREVHLSSGS